MKRFLLLAITIVSICAIAHAESPAAPFSVRGFGAVGDGTSLDTAAVQKTIDACAAAGGGTVYFPAGDYLEKYGDASHISWI